jgi:hypothetical protein
MMRDAMGRRKSGGRGGAATQPSAAATANIFCVRLRCTDERLWESVKKKKKKLFKLCYRNTGSKVQGYPLLPADVQLTRVTTVTTLQCTQILQDFTIEHLCPTPTVVVTR